jgi:hypothetical protein
VLANLIPMLASWRGGGAAGGGGKLVQELRTDTTAVVTTGLTIPTDDTVPQIGEATEVLALAITPQALTNYLVIEFDGFATPSSLRPVFVALFRDGAANAIHATVAHWGSSGTLRLRHVMAVPSLVATTFSARFASTGGTAYVNGSNAGGRWFGGVGRAVLSIREVAP